MDLKFRTLRSDEIECRAQSVTEKGVILLLYKDARCDMNLLDETVGPLGWQREQYEVKGNLFSRVGIKDTESGEWIWKSDAGSPSNQEAEKGHSSDAFKRACFNWGIGRELYTTPFIWVKLAQEEVIKGKNGRYQLANSVKFSVKGIHYDQSRSIQELVISDQTGKNRYVYKANGKRQTISQDEIAQAYAWMNEKGYSKQGLERAVYKNFACTLNELPKDKWQQLMDLILNTEYKQAKTA